jgi:hypothetical protein
MLDIWLPKNTRVIALINIKNNGASFDHQSKTWNLSEELREWLISNKIDAIIYEDGFPYIRIPKKDLMLFKLTWL